MRIIYPMSPLNKKEADEPYQKEFTLLRSRGADCSLFDFDALDFEEFEPSPKIESDETVLYRGWMLSPMRYQKLVNGIESKNAKPFTTFKDYMHCHHIPNWYDLCVDYTPESKFFPYDDHLLDNVRQLGWDKYFVKDFVKSNSNERGSIASSVEEVGDIGQLIHNYRGEIEGGITVRRVESYKDQTEVRYFVLNGQVYSPLGEVPEIVNVISKRINAPFYSIDIIQRHDGKYRLIEIGDGQVSDRKTWSIEVFSSMILETINKDNL